VPDEVVRKSLAFKVNAVYESKINAKCLTLGPYNLIVVKRTYDTAKQSCLRHEYFSHVVPLIWRGDANGRHSKSWKKFEEDMNERFAECLRTQSSTVAPTVSPQ